MFKHIDEKKNVVNLYLFSFIKGYEKGNNRVYQNIFLLLHYNVYVYINKYTYRNIYIFFFLCF